MMATHWLRNPLVSFGIYLALSLVLYYVAGKTRTGSGGKKHRRLPYACGQDLLPSETRLSYKRFYRLALMFIVVHMAALVAILILVMQREPVLAVVYLVGTIICVDILTRGGD